jgi:nucleoside-diphosphate-sugar epimerase
MNLKKALIVGCGDLGRRLSKPLHAGGFEVSGLRRTTSELAADILPLQGDVTCKDSLRVIAAKPWDVVIITLTARGEEAYNAVYVEGVANLIAVLKQSSTKPLLLFASSTSVYAQNGGEIVDETSTISANSYSARAMQLAERQLSESGFDQAAIRFSGIYGRGRGGHLLEALQKGQICAKRPIRYSNRIHIDDCIGIFMHLIDRYFQGKALQPVYLGSDNCPTPLREIMEWLAAQYVISVDRLKPTFAANRGGSKRCSNQLLIESGYQFSYPDYKSGYLAANTAE